MLARGVLTADVRFEGWTTEDWIRFLRLWQPRAKPEREPTRPRGGVILVHEDGAVLKLLHTHRGRLDPASAAAPDAPSIAHALALRADHPEVLGAIARTHRASWALGMQLGALDEVMERLGARLRRGDDPTARSPRGRSGFAASPCPRRTSFVARSTRCAGTDARSRWASSTGAASGRRSLRADGGSRSM